MSAITDQLHRVAREMELGLWSPVAEAILFTRDAGTGTITVARWGEETGLAEDVGWHTDIPADAGHHEEAPRPS